MNWIDRRDVSVSACAEYDTDRIEAVLRTHFAAMGCDETFFAGKRVVLKPNLVTAVEPDKGVTTHPSLIEAACRVITSLGGRVTIAESGGGPYTEATMKNAYRITGTADAARRGGAELNFDPSSVPASYPDGKQSCTFELLRPVADADIIVNIAKLKTHTLTMLSACVKNLFGCVPGLKKFELHARFDDQRQFQSALVDLCAMLCSQKDCIHILDAVVGMEGNGPTGGTPHPLGWILSGVNPFAVDTAAAALIGLEGAVPMLTEGVSRGYCPAHADELSLRGALTPVDPGSYRMPDTRRAKKFDHIPKFLQARPVISQKRCIGCGRCARSCPAKTISGEKRDGRMRYTIRYKSCIRCFCCQELCPEHAVDIHRSWIFRLLT